MRISNHKQIQHFYNYKPLSIQIRQRIFLRRERQNQNTYQTIKAIRHD